MFIKSFIVLWKELMLTLLALIMGAVTFNYFSFDSAGLYDQIERPLPVQLLHSIVHWEDLQVLAFAFRAFFSDNLNTYVCWQMEISALSWMSLSYLLACANINSIPLVVEVGAFIDERKFLGDKLGSAPLQGVAQRFGFLDMYYGRTGNLAGLAFR